MLKSWGFVRCLGALAPAAAVCAFGAWSASAQDSARQVDFKRDVQPLLAENCLACHNPKLRTGGLSMGSRAELLQGGGRGPAAAAGHPEHSLLIGAVRQEGGLKMPPGRKLADAEIATLEAWVRGGLTWGESLATAVEAQKHWAFDPIAKPEPPAVADKSWPLNPIDYFVLARLDQDGIKPSPEAGRATLIRRVSLDLLGLPPTPEEVDAFVADMSPDAYEELVDRLLGSPHYGERWGRRWLDVARYADSNGYNIDGAREIWMYRDWVINALNRDLPFDQFVIEQIAGDLLPNATTDQIVATGFQRNTLINLEGGIDFEQYRVEAVVDRVDATGSAFLGLTLGCARCHDHKFDPIAQRDFYQMYAFYNSVDELSGKDGEEGRKTAHKPILEFGSDEELATRDVVQGQLALLEADAKKYLAERRPAWEASLTPDQIGELPDNVRENLGIPVDKRNRFQQGSIDRAFREADLGYRERQASIRHLRERLPKLRTTMVMKELAEPRQAYIQLGGDFLRKGAEVQPDTPAALPPLEKPEAGLPNRLDLARWLVDERNPLTARVTVNRIWQRYFGLGIVETENDFGTQGSPPTHPKLLDWLASEFRDEGWSMKKLHRLIVTSATYRQSSAARKDLELIDPRNRLLARQSRLRLDAEIIRDAALTASGLLARKIGGPSVRPPQPNGASKLGQMQREWVADTDENRYRRGMYTFFWRSSPHPGLMVFDSPDSMAACTRRIRSNTPLQALTLLNDKGHYEFAEALAKRVRAEGEDETERLERAFRLCLARSPRPSEAERLASYLAAERDAFQANAEQAKLIAPDANDEREAAEIAAWTALSRVLLNVDEFVTRE